MAPLMRLAELTGTASDVRVLTSSIAPQSFDVGRRMLRNGDQETEMILDERTLDAIVGSDRYGEGLVADLRERPLDLWVHEGEVPYQDLKPYPDAPMMINGYLTTMVVTLIPPLWHRLMTPKVLAWDRDYATAEERELAARANERSGIPTLAGQHSVVESIG